MNHYFVIDFKIIKNMIETCFNALFHRRIIISLSLINTNFIAFIGNLCLYPVLQRNDLWYHSKVSGIYNWFHSSGVNRFQSRGRKISVSKGTDCQPEENHRGYLSGAAHNTRLEFTDTGIQWTVTKRKKQNLQRTLDRFVRSASRTAL